MSTPRCDKICPICKTEVGGDVVQIRQKDADVINEASVRRGNTIAVAAGCEVHSNCRKMCTNIREIEHHLKRNRTVKPAPLIK